MVWVLQLKIKRSISFSKDTEKLLQKYCNEETRSMSNMIEIMIKTYDKLQTNTI